MTLFLYCSLNSQTDILSVGLNNNDDVKKNENYVLQHNKKEGRRERNNFSIQIKATRGRCKTHVLSREMAQF